VIPAITRAMMPLRFSYVGAGVLSVRTQMSYRASLSMQKVKSEFSTSWWNELWTDCAKERGESDVDTVGPPCEALTGGRCTARRRCRKPGETELSSTRRRMATGLRGQAHLGRGQNAKGCQHAVGIFLLDLRQEQGPQSRPGTSSQRRQHLKPLQQVAPLSLRPERLEDLVN
jgi:hypothetical protein